jgi:hypothetical protein
LAEMKSEGSLGPKNLIEYNEALEEPRLFKKE